MKIKKKLTKEVEKMELSETDRFQILNNRFKKEEDLVLKVRNTAALTPKDRKVILDLKEE